MGLPMRQLERRSQSKSSHKKKKKSGPTIGLVNQPIPKHTTNGSLPTPPINTTNVVTVEGQNQTTTERQRTQITYLTQQKKKKKQPMILYITKEPIAVNTTRELR